MLGKAKSKLLFIITLFIFSTWRLNLSASSLDEIGLLGEPVYDRTSAVNFGKNLEAWERQFQQFENYKEQIGNGELTPSTVNKLSKLYEKCGGKKFGLPDWFPRFKVEMCADDGQLFALQVDFYKDTVVILSSDSETVRKKKQEKELKVQ